MTPRAENYRHDWTAKSFSWIARAAAKGVDALSRESRNLLTQNPDITLALIWIASWSKPKAWN
ncbi:hypothetical protein [Phyllobacterium sp. YR531]|uniref:hypothetical protein n=1 Tax=Phyllobacterium sp. YR531 TaxID=1144343 RepID=UPI0002F6ED4F|nr:hypothetical protein [Phyllobacterium sp. YR531]